MSDRGVLTILSGFSGSGKGTVVRRLLEKYDNYAVSVSVTTRNPRPGEEEGKAYFFRSENEFQKMVKEDAFLEYASYVDHSYGTPRSYVEENMEAGKDVILEIEMQGAMQVKKKMPEALLLFVTPPSADELKRRLCGRGTETEEVIASRLKRAAEEAEGMEKYDYLVVNDTVEDCVDQIHSLIRNEHLKMSANTGFIREIKKELTQFK